MKNTLLGILSLICLLATVLWLVFLVAGVAADGPLDTFEQILNHVSKTDAGFYATYANAAIVTTTAVMLFAALYLYCKPQAATWAAIGMTFVPIYGAMNLVVYLSQITVVPSLLELQQLPQYRPLSLILLRQVIQQWPDSAVFMVNNLAYAVLGVPSIIFGVLLFRSATALRLAGVLLALNGLTCIAGYVGIVAHCRWLSHGSLLGGVIFLLALARMSWVFCRMKDVGRPATRR